MSDYSDASPPPRKEKRDKKEKKEKKDKKEKKEKQPTTLPKKLYYNVELPEFIVAGLLTANKVDIRPKDVQMRILMKRKKQ